MNNISRVSLEDTLYLIQLMRETALSQGRQTQANRLTPVMEEMRTLVTNTRQPQAAPSAGMMGQSDFKVLLEATQSRASEPQPASSTASVMERNRMISAMAEGDMSDLEIARQFGMTREEVRLVLNVQQKNRI